VTATIEPLVVTNGAWSSVLEVHAAANKAPATHALTVTATGVGVATQTTQLLLTVTAPLAPSLNVILDLDGFLCAWTTLGGSWPWSIIVQRLGGYTGPVNLTIEGLPPSVTASFNVSDDAGGGMSGIVTFTAESNARVGSSYATIRARGVGGADATTQFLFCVAPTS
jgi:hypothetical protein